MSEEMAPVLAVQGTPVGTEGAPEGQKPKGKRKCGTGRYVLKVDLDAAKAEIVALRARLESWEASEADDGEITASKMKRVMGQEAVLDRGATERTLRAWLEKDVKGYDARMRELAAEERNLAAQEEELVRLRREVAELRGRQTVDTTSRAAAEELVDSILARTGAEGLRS